MKFRVVRCLSSLVLVFVLPVAFAAAQSATPSSNTGSPASAQSNSAQSNAAQSGKPAGDAQSTDQASDPLKRPVTEKQKKDSAKALKQELSSTYKKWLNQDVAYIITPEEKLAFKQLSNDEERDQFIEQFWLRRDPTPDTP